LSKWRNKESEDSNKNLPFHSESEPTPAYFIDFVSVQKKYHSDKWTNGKPSVEAVNQTQSLFGYLFNMSSCNDRVEKVSVGQYSNTGLGESSSVIMLVVFRVASIIS